MTHAIDGKKYDRIYVGTSMIPVLDAIHHSSIGESVLMIDIQPSIGGAWRSIDAFGLHDVENAIHYLLPQREASRFMRDSLGWTVINSPRKFRIFPLYPFGRIRVTYDNFIGRVIARAVEASGSLSLLGIITAIPKAFWEILRDTRDPSYYISGGSNEMISKVQGMLDSSKVEVAFSTEILSISLDCRTEEVLLHTTAGSVHASTCIISHGSKLAKLEGYSGKLNIIQKHHPRPAMHMLISDSSESLIYEAVFTGDSLIKYAHDITRFTKEAANIIGTLKVFVFALRHQIQESDAVYEEIFEKLKWSGMIGPEAVLKDRFWSHVTLPTIDDDDLATIKAAFNGKLDYLRTEDFAAGIGYYSPRWTSSISNFIPKIDE